MTSFFVYFLVNKTKLGYFSKKKLDIPYIL